MVALVSRFIGAVPIDVVISESHESQLEITDNPVEKGADISDHAWIKPKTLTLNFIAGSKPNSLAGAALAFQALRLMQETCQPFAVVSGLGVYKDMLIKSLSAERTSRFGQVLYGTVELKQVIITSTQSTSGDGGAGGKNAKDAATGKRTTATTAKPGAAGAVKANGAVATPSAPAAPPPSQSSLSKILGVGK